MLHNLPVEVILSVSNLLDFDDKLSLNATCKKLNDLISKTNLYEDFDLDDFPASYNRILKEFESEQSKGAQVKKLNIDINHLAKGMVPRLSSIFPNVASFSVYDTHNYRNYDPHTISEPVSTWIKTIETYHTLKDWKPLWFTLEYHTFPNLTELEIEEGPYVKLIKKHGPSAIHLLPYLKNAPSLKKLTIRPLDATLEFLEELHASCPHLKSLTLDGTVFLLDNDNLPETIVPAHSVWDLDLNRIVCTNRIELLLDYIIRKYPKLRRLGFVLQHSQFSVSKRLNDYYLGFDRYHEKYNEKRRFTSYYDDRSDEDDDGDDEDDPEIHDYYEGEEISKREYKRLFSGYKSTLKLYHISAPAFFSSLPTTIKSLKVEIELFNLIIELLCKSDMKLTELSIQNAHGMRAWKYEETIQYAYIKDLTTLKTLDTKLNASEQVMTRGFTSSSITKLDIKISGGLFYLDWLLSSFPSLENLVIGGYQQTLIQIRDTSKLNHRNLRKLQIKTMDVQDCFFDFIKDSTPNMKVLDLAVNIKADPKTEDKVRYFDMSGWNLNKCDLSIKYSFQTEDIDCKITIGDVTRRFIFTCHSETVKYPRKDYLFSSMENALHMHLKCGYIEDFRVEGLRIKKYFDEIIIAP